MSPLTLIAAIGYLFIGSVIGVIVGIGLGVIGVMASTEYRTSREKLRAAKEARRKITELVDALNLKIMKQAEKKFEAEQGPTGR